MMMMMMMVRAPTYISYYIIAFQRDESLGGLFSVTEEEQKSIRALNIRGKDHAQQKFAVIMAAYLFELGYDLAHLIPTCREALALKIADYIVPLKRKIIHVVDCGVA